MATERMISYAQNLEDVMLWRALGGLDAPGFYIDVGAADPTDLSVTRAFYDRGWRGINVEPLPEQASLLAEARPRDITVAAAVADAPGQRRFHRVHSKGQTGLSTLDPAEAASHAEHGAEVDSFEVPVTTLAALCREHVRGPVHFLKIDAEGAEAAVLAGADLHTTRPWIILLEATKPLQGSASEVEWEPALLAAGYRFVWFDGLNRFYLADEHAELARHFQVPPNVFDHYVQHDAVLHGQVATLERRTAELDAAAQARGAAILDLQAELARLHAAALAAPPPAPPPPPPPSPPPVLPDPPATRSRSGFAFALWRLVRPIARPIAWRSRGFLTRELGRDLGALHAKQDTVLARLEALAAPRPPPSPTLDPGTTAVMERLLLTLALENAADPFPPGFADTR